jgi:hypothetical protein
MACGGGWLVCAPTGASTACSGLVELVAAARPWLGPPVPSEASSGRVVAPGPDSRRGVHVRVDPAGIPFAGAEIAVPDKTAALRVIADLAAPPWSLRWFFAELSGVDEPWGGAPTRLDVDTADQAADLVVWLECARQAGAFDDTAIVARCPLDADTELDVEVRAGHVVRARSVNVEGEADGRAAAG